MTDARLTPVPEDNFAFGLWTIGNIGRDPFGEPTRAPMTPADFVRGLARVGASGVVFHDDDLITPGSSVAEADKAKKDFRAALDETGVRVTTGSTNMFSLACFKDGAFTSNDPGVRRFAIAKSLRAVDLAAEFDAEMYIFWGGREGMESGISKDPRDALERYREGVNYVVAYAKDQGYSMKFVIEPKPNEPRGDTFLPTIGHALAFIETLDDPSVVGINPEFAHEMMANLSFYQGVAQVLWHGKLFHIDLNDQKATRYDQDFRFASENLKENFLLVRLLENAGYKGTKHFDSKPYRNEWGDGVWEFAQNSMRTYLALAAAARAFDADPEVKAAMAAAGVGDLAKPTVGKYSRQEAAALKAEEIDFAALAQRGYFNERLDQLMIEHIMGFRGR
jgi:xylose isomerase